MHTIEIINMYEPIGKETNAFLTTHTPNADTLIAGDFNVYHTMWHAEEATNSTELIKNIQQLGLTLQIIPENIHPLPKSQKIQGISSSPVDML